MKTELAPLAEAVRRQMSERRWTHTLGVVGAARELAQRFGGDADKAELAALLHDYAKDWPAERLERVLRERDLAPDLLEYDKELWHAHVGAWAVREEHGIADEEVLDAIRWHTSGREGMTLLDKIVCLADYIEPGREYPGAGDIRELARHDLDWALAAAFDNTIRFLLERGRLIYPLTVLARNDLLRRARQRREQS
jgi:predicted HD superfamily hydrolase involved in NAD metabolism